MNNRAEDKLDNAHLMRIGDCERKHRIAEEYLATHASSEMRATVDQHKCDGNTVSTEADNTTVVVRATPLEW